MRTRKSGVGVYLVFLFIFILWRAGFPMGVTQERWVGDVGIERGFSPGSSPRSRVLDWKGAEGFGLAVSAVPSRRPVKRPPLRWKRVLGEFLVGEVAGAGLGYLGYYTAFGMKNIVVERSERALLAFAVGSTLGSVLGVNWVGRMGDETGSWKMSFFGCAMGAVVGSLPAVLINEVVEDRKVRLTAMFFSFTACEVVGTIIGFNLTRKKQRVLGQGVRGRSWSLLTPRPCLGPQGRFVWRWDLVHVVF